MLVTSFCVVPNRYTEALCKMPIFYLCTYLQMIELEQAGANLLATDQQGNTCLHLAARFGHKDIVKFLIEAAPSAILDMADHEK